MPDDDLADALLGFTNYVMNERVRCYNEGVDAERERCLQAARDCPALDENGYICQKSDVLKAILNQEATPRVD